MHKTPGKATEIGPCLILWGNGLWNEYIQTATMTHAHISLLTDFNSCNQTFFYLCVYLWCVYMYDHQYVMACV